MAANRSCELIEFKLVFTVRPFGNFYKRPMPKISGQLKVHIFLRDTSRLADLRLTAGSWSYISICAKLVSNALQLARSRAFKRPAGWGRQERGEHTMCVVRAPSSAIKVAVEYDSTQSECHIWRTCDKKDHRHGQDPDSPIAQIIRLDHRCMDNRHYMRTDYWCQHLLRLKSGRFFLKLIT